jgi:hypothetical protein
MDQAQGSYARHTNMQFQKKANILYGHNWSGNDPVAIEMACIRKGGRWKNEEGAECGNGNFFHYRRLMQLLWPGEWWSRWDDLIVQELTAQPSVFLGISGPASSGKTHRVSRFALCLYFCFPNNTTILCSTTTRELLEMRIFGEIKKGFRKARERFPWLPGNFIESRQLIVTDERGDELGREIRNCIKGVACKKGGQWEGLGDYIGIKNDIVMLAADEAQLMEQGFFDSTGNLSSNPRFILVGMGNPKDTTDSFGKMCEPIPGWEAHDQPDSTHAWDTRFRNGRCLRLVGTDSPNMDRKDGLILFPKLIARRYIDQIANTYGTESWQYLMWVMAKFPLNAQARRVITMAMCRKFKAFEPVSFGTKITKLFALDAAYSAVGGDRCVGLEMHFGECTDGVRRLFLATAPMILPVSQEKGLPEDQIAQWVKDYCMANQIPSSHCFFDGTGRSSLTSALARLWAADVVPVEFGGMATDRPSPQNPRKTCREMYGKFVTELWFTSRVAIEADQIRGLTESIAEEGQLRVWTINNNGKVDVEKKDDTKLRLGRSPDLYDAFVTGLEGARRLGFQIGKLGKIGGQKESELLRLRNKWTTMIKSRELHAA